MANNKIDIMHGTAREMLSALHLTEAMDMIEAMGRETNALKELDELARIRETYGFMMHYMEQGMADPDRRRMHKEMVENLRSLADSILRLARSVSEPDFYSSQLRLVNLRKERIPALIAEYSSALAESSLAELAGNEDDAPRRKKEAVLERLFSVVFTSIGDTDDYRMITESIGKGNMDHDFDMQMASAMTLALLCYYDRRKFSSLLDIYENAVGANHLLAARSLVGIVLVMSRHTRRITDDDALMARLSLWQDSIDTYRNLRETIRAIISTRDTDRVTSKMKDEVIPELMKMRPDIMRKLGEIQSDPEAALSENNPEWEEMLDKSGLTKKMQELSEMQSDGADLMMVTFSNLKQFAFFRSACNWFMPFSVANSALSSMNAEMKAMVERLMEMSGTVCHSDMYSLALALAQMPQAQRDMIGAQFSQQLSQLKEEAKDRSLHSSVPEFDTEVVKSVRDLYRFFKLFRSHADFQNPFDNPLDFMSLPVVGGMMAEDEVLRLIGEFYFKRGYYREALPVFESLAQSNPEEAALHEKTGFCHQQLKNYGKAMEAYSKAELLHTPGPWLLKKIAIVAKRMGDYRKASEYYSRALENDPENLTLIMSAGHSELESGNIAGALAHYYHANYLNPDDLRIIRALGWLELLNRNFDKSVSYYARIPEADATASDRLNRGHALYLAGKVRDAVVQYRMATGDNPAAFISAFEADISTLQSLGVDNREAHILLDALTRKA